MLQTLHTRKIFYGSSTWSHQWWQTNCIYIPSEFLYYVHNRSICVALDHAPNFIVLQSNIHPNISRIYQCQHYHSKTSSKIHLCHWWTSTYGLRLRTWLWLEPKIQQWETCHKCGQIPFLPPYHWLIQSIHLDLSYKN